MRPASPKYETERIQRFRAMKLSKGDKQTIGRIEKFGCEVVQVKSTISGPGWSYSVGVYDTSGKP